MTEEVDELDKTLLSHKLQVEVPPLTAWQWQASVLSILWGHQQTHNWIYSNYILPSCTGDDWSEGKRLFVDFIPHPFFDNCPWLKCRIIDRSWIKEKWGNTRDFLCECIKEGYYIFTLADQKDIRGLQNRYFHELFIFGYDLESNHTYIADFINEKFRFAKADLDVTCKAIESVSEADDYWDDFRGGVYLFKLVDNMGYDFHPDIVKQSLFLFLNPQFILSPKDLKSTRYKVNKIYYGVDVYDCFIKHIEKSMQLRIRWDQRAFHNLYDHKVLMSKRILFMMKNEYISNSKEYINVSEWIERRVQALCNLCIKMNLTGSWEEQKCKHMIDSLNATRKAEVDLYKSIISELSQ